MKPQEKDRTDIINFVQGDLTAVELRKKWRFSDPSNCPLEEIDNAISDDSIPFCSVGSKFDEEVSLTESFNSRCFKFIN